MKWNNSIWLNFVLNSVLKIDPDKPMANISNI